MPPTPLSTFLTSRRSQVRPADVDMKEGPGRRVPGLRREEVALLAGVSVDYYTRLEQGRERAPSVSVLNALCGALNLDHAACAHVFRLAGLAPEDTPGPEDEEVHPSLVALLQLWGDTPALIINRCLDVLALNKMAAALYSDFDQVDNLVRMAFVDPVGVRFFKEWQQASESCVANLRLALGFSGNNARARALVRDLESASGEFRRIWNLHNVRGKAREAKTFHHGDVGDLVLEYQAFDVRAAPGQQLIVYQPVAHTPSADKIHLLGALAATRDQVSQDR